MKTNHLLLAAIVGLLLPATAASALATPKITYQCDWIIVGVHSNDLVVYESGEQLLPSGELVALWTIPGLGPVSCGGLVDDLLPQGGCTGVLYRSVTGATGTFATSSLQSASPGVAVATAAVSAERAAAQMFAAQAPNGAYDATTNFADATGGNADATQRDASAWAPSFVAAERGHGFTYAGSASGAAVAYATCVW